MPKSKPPSVSTARNIGNNYLLAFKVGAPESKLHMTLLYINNVKRGYEQDRVKLLAEEIMEELSLPGTVPLDFNAPNTADHGDQTTTTAAAATRAQGENRQKQKDDETAKRQQQEEEYKFTDRCLMIYNEELEQFQHTLYERFTTLHKLDCRPPRPLHVDLRGGANGGIAATLCTRNNWYY